MLIVIELNEGKQSVELVDIIKKMKHAKRLLSYEKGTSIGAILVSPKSIKHIVDCTI